MSRISPTKLQEENAMTTGVNVAPAMEGPGRPEEMKDGGEHRMPWLTLAGVIRGDNLQTRNALVGMIAGEEVQLERSAARAVVSEDRVEMRQAAAQMILAAGDVSMTQAGAQAVASNGSIRIERGGAGIAVGRRIEVGEHALVVVGIAPSLNMTGGRVLFGPVAAATVIGGVIAALFAVRVLLRRGRAVEGGNRS
jgi:hypothetical protein